MKTIFKYKLDQDINIIKIPEEHKILSIETQYNNVVLYALVNTESKVTNRVFHMIGTGWNVSDEVYNMDYIGTAITFDGKLVWHIFSE